MKKKTFKGDKTYKLIAYFTTMSANKDSSNIADQIRELLLKNSLYGYAKVKEDKKNRLISKDIEKWKLESGELLF